MNAPSRSRWRLVRELLLFLGGLAGIAYEALAKATERPTLLFAYLTMMGLATYFRVNHANRKNSAA